MNILSLKNVNLFFSNRQILNNISFNVDSSSVISISGKSGSGKTSLLSIIFGLLNPDSGEVLYREKNIYKWNDFRRSKYRNRKIGFVFQSFNLLPDINVYQNIIYPAVLNPSARNVKGEINYLMRFMGIENIKNQYPSTISGGEKQRTSIARAMINHPDIILADEPTGNLDTKTGKMIFTLFKEIQERYNIILIIVTHDRYIIRNSDFHYALIDGKLIPKKA